MSSKLIINVNCVNTGPIELLLFHKAERTIASQHGLCFWTMANLL